MSYDGAQVTCGGCGTASTITHPLLNHACPTCRRVLNGIVDGRRRADEPDLG